MGGRGDAQGPGQPERTAGSDRVRRADSTQEPVPGLAAADRAADRIAPGLSGDGILAPRAQSGHAWPPALVIEPDSNDDSNTSDQRQAAATDNSA